MSIKRGFTMNNSRVIFSDTNAHLIKKRLEELEMDYISDPVHAECSKKEVELIAELSRLLGKEHIALLQEYANLITLRNDSDAEWFYRKGFNDSLLYATEYAVFS
jgi:hypothetical protein